MKQISKEEDKLFTSSLHFYPEAHGVQSHAPSIPIERHKFFQISSKWESRKNRFAFTVSLTAKSSFYLPAFEISR